MHAVAGGLDDGRVRVVALGAGDGKLEIQQPGGIDPGVAHVVAVADPGNPTSADIAAQFEPGLHVGEQLAGMQQVGQAVDDRHAGVSGEGFDALVTEGPDHHHIHHAGNDAGGILDRLAAAELAVARRQEHCMTAELGHAGLEGNPGTGRGFLEDHRHHPARQGVVQPSVLQGLLDRDGVIDQLAEFVGG